MCVMRCDDDLDFAYPWLDASTTETKDTGQTFRYPMDSSQGVVELVQRCSVESTNTWFRL